MIFIKIILLIIASISFLVVASVNKYKTLNKLMIVVFFLISAYFILFPKQSDIVASYLDIKSGVQLVVYISVSILFLFLVSLYVKVKRQDKVITKIIRKRSLDKYVKNIKHNN